MGLPLDVYSWEGERYQPLLRSHDWMVALMNWDPIWALDKAIAIERHRLTDEVFVLLCGQGAFYLASETGLEVIEIQPRLVYNVHKGGWHNLLAIREARFLIVENQGTEENDTEVRLLTPQEQEALVSKAPSWAH